MFIPNDQVTSWEDLQDRVAQHFREMGYEASTTEHVELAGRGKKQIDVWVRDVLASVNQIYLVECKWWDHNVPQEIAHAFKTVMEESGANTGFIVSKRGFQAGAREAVRFTNIHLLTFVEFQHTYGAEWFRKQRSKLDALVGEIRAAGRLHWDQHSPLPIINNMIFHTPELNQRFLHLWRQGVNLVIQAGTVEPSSYLTPGPIGGVCGPNDPLKARDASSGKPPFEFQDVRHYFKVMHEATGKWIEDFEQLRNEARTSFDQLPKEAQEQAWQHSLGELAGEAPIRSLEHRLPKANYQWLQEMLPTSDCLTAAGETAEPEGD